MKIIKKILKKILRILGWKLIKIRRRKPISFTNSQPSKELFETMINSNGVLHIGAHRGMEAENYNWLNKRVIWIEAIDELFVELNDHVQNYYNQRAYCALIGDKNCIHDFYISNNDAASVAIPKGGGAFLIPPKLPRTRGEIKQIVLFFINIHLYYFVYLG